MNKLYSPQNRPSSGPVLEKSPMKDMDYGTIAKPTPGNPGSVNPDKSEAGSGTVASRMASLSTAMSTGGNKLPPIPIAQSGSQPNSSRKGR